MSLETRLAHELVRAHPHRAAAVLEGLPAGDAARVLAAVPPPQASAVLERMLPSPAATRLAALDDARAARVIAGLPLDVAARLIRRVEEVRRPGLVARLPPRIGETLTTLLRFPEHTAGALMDPGVLALPEDVTVREGVRRVRSSPESAQYNVYVVDREQRLVGVLNLRELLRARPRKVLRDVMVRNPARLLATADRTVILAHPAWRSFRALPVVDEQGGYLGALRFHVYRQLEEDLRGSVRQEVSTAEALGDVFAAGAAGVLDALTGVAADQGDRE